MRLNKERVSMIINLLKKEYPDVKTALENWTNNFQFLVSIILSAQTTDKQVNKVTVNLFKKYLSIEDFANAKLEILQKEIGSIGFFRQKAKNIINCAKDILSKYNGVIPQTIEELIVLPGVGRKTANVFINVTSDNYQGIAVDTHVRRLSQRLGITKNVDPAKIEVDLMKLIDKEKWEIVTLLLIEHGRQICKAQNPLCEKCLLNKMCPSAFKVGKYFKS